MLDSNDLDTETFTNSQGWTVVRVTHRPSGVSAERQRSRELASSVRAQRECIAELHELVGRRDTLPERPRHNEPVSRQEFEALVDRVAELEQRLR